MTIMHAAIIGAHHSYQPTGYHTQSGGERRAFYVPDGVFQMTAVLIGGGGASSTDRDLGWRADAQSGGGGGALVSLDLKVMPGQYIEVETGAGGVGPSAGGYKDGEDGGDTSLYIDGYLQAVAHGGGGGYFADPYVTATGGAGGGTFRLQPAAEGSCVIASKGNYGGSGAAGTSSGSAGGGGGAAGYVSYGGRGTTVSTMSTTAYGGASGGYKGPGGGTALYGRTGYQENYAGGGYGGAYAGDTTYNGETYYPNTGGGYGGMYGGGGGGRFYSGAGADGGDGAARLVWHGGTASYVSNSGVGSEWDINPVETTLIT